MLEFIYLDEDGIVKVYLPAKTNWQVTEMPADFELVFRQRLTEDELQKILARRELTIEDLNEADLIKSLFLEESAIEIFAFQSRIDSNNNSEKEKVWKIYCCKKCCRCKWICVPSEQSNNNSFLDGKLSFSSEEEERSYQVLPTPSSNNCNKNDYNLNIFYDRVWLCGENIRTLNSLGLLDKSKYTLKIRCRIEMDIFWCEYNYGGWEVLREPIYKMMKDAGWNPNNNKLDCICRTIATRVYNDGNPMRLLINNCGVRFTNSDIEIVKSTTVTQY